MKLSPFWIGCALALAAAVACTQLIGNEYAFLAGFSIVQLVMLATAWNILGGTCGYVNFGTGAFVAVGAYTGVALGRAFDLPLPVQILSAGVFGGALGLGIGAMSLRLKGIFFAIATFALAVIVEVTINHWEYVGGARGTAVVRPNVSMLFGSYNRYLFVLMTFLALGSIAVARYVQNSWLGRGMQALRDNEAAAEGCGVPTLQLKLIAATLSGALLGMSGTLMPQMMSYVEPTSLFAISLAVMALAMPMVGGTSHWAGPIVGAIVLGAIQQTVTVTISSEANVLIVGVLLVVAVVAAPNGIVGLVQPLLRRIAGRGAVR